MKALKYLLFLLLIGIIGFSIYIAVQPNSFEISRTRAIKAPAAVIYDNVIDFKNWPAWSSWVESDPDMKITFPETTKGVGGSYSWEDKDGIGTMETIETDSYNSIQQIMRFVDLPPSDISWRFEPNDDGSTNTTWTISGKNLPFMFKLFSVLMGGMEAQIGPHYERSLEKLDSIVVADMQKYSVKVDGITIHSGGFYIYNSTSCKINQMEAKIKEMFPRIKNYAMDNNIPMSRAPFIYYHKWDEENNAVMFSCCLPTTSKVITTESDILTGQLMPFTAVITTLNGNHSNLKEAWETTMNYISKNNLALYENGPMLETYINDPTNTPNPANLKTQIFVAIKQ
jgi:effector-binding domain-containing protein